jgi:hypothetical protein
MSGIAERGPAALLQLLSERLRDLRELDVDAFPAWLEPHLASWSSDPVFVQRARIRDLRRTHPDIPALEEARRLARIRYEASPLYPTIEALEKDLVGANKAVAGLTYALRSAGDGTERDDLRRKRDHHAERVAELEIRIRDATAASPERLELEGLVARLERAREAAGFHGEVAALDELQRKQGRSSGRSGAAFEREAAAMSVSTLLPELAESSRDPLVVLHGVKLGAARTEIDQLVVRVPARPTQPVEVLALIEVKRNPNDLAHGYLRRLENLSWLSGAGGYDPLAYRTVSSPTGHFENEAIHGEGGTGYRFTRDSFARFLPDLLAGSPPRHLYLVTRPGNLWGVDSAALGRIAHRVSSDVEWDPEDPRYLGALLDWCRGLAAPVEAPDLVRSFASDTAASRRLILLDP